MTRNEDAMSNEVASITPKSYLQEDSTLVEMNLVGKKKFDRKNVFQIFF